MTKQGEKQDKKPYRPGIDGPSAWPTCSVCGKELELLGPGITNGFDECCESDPQVIEPYDPNDPDNPF